MKRPFYLAAAALLALTAVGCGSASDGAVINGNREDTPVFENDDPVVSDFMLDLILLEDECYGSAGALLTVEPDLTWLGNDSKLDAGEDWTLIYEIHGGEYGTETYNLTVHGDDGSYSYDEHIISTASCYYDVSVEIVRVR
jgi:hypothetical protein